MSKMLDNKVALVSGGASGIGRATALLFAVEGARVVVTDRDCVNGEETCHLINKSGGQAIFVASEACSEEDQERVVKTALSHFKELHVACNNAGVGGTPVDVADCPISEWHRIIDINLTAVYIAMRKQIPALQIGQSGSIINVASVMAQVGFGGHAAYTASKHGVLGLTRSAALEYSSRGVRVNAIGPGFIETPMLNALPADQLDNLIAQHPIGRLGQAREVAEIIAWLGSDRSSFVTGAYYAVDGGFLAK